jgi:class 3 adenylate cyclase
MASTTPQTTPFLRRGLSGDTLRRARIAVVVMLVPLAVLFIRWVLRWIDARTSYAVSFPEYAGSTPLHVAVFASIAVSLIAVAVWWALAALVFARRSRDVYGLVLTTAFFFFGGCLIDSSRFTPLARAEELPFGTALLFMANSWTLPWVFAFPNGRLIPRWAPVVIALWMGWYVIRSISPLFDPVGPLIGIWAIAPVFAVGTFVYRAFGSNDIVQRAQLKWIAWAGLFFLIPWAILNFAEWASLFTGDNGLIYSTAASFVFAVGVLMIALAIAAAIFRAGLLDIDLLLNRTLTYAALTAILVAAFIAISRTAERVLVASTGQSSDVVLVATVIPLAVLFLPLRTALLRFAARFLSGSRVLTVLFVDIAGSTELAVRIGDRAWRRTLEEFRATVRPLLRRYDGEEIDTAGDAFFVTFDGPARAIRCAQAVTAATRGHGFGVRVGVHIGEVQVYAEGVSGVAVHFTMRLMSLARPGEIVVSQALRDVIAGSNIRLEDRGDHELKGIPGTARVFCVAPA